MTTATFSLKSETPAPTFAFTQAEVPKALTEKHRPRTLAEIVGQGWAVDQLETFVGAPYPCAFLFEGETGVGKTTAALALARDLGCDMTWAVHTIKSGEQDAEAVETALRTLRFTAPGSGWKVVIVDEADHMSTKAANLWLSALEDLPAKSVIVFTTNHVSKFPQRFRDRCEVIKFESDAPTLIQDAQLLIDRVWAAEGAPGDSPRAADVPGLIDANGKISFRRAVRTLEPLIRRAQAGLPVATPKAPRPAAEPAPKAGAKPAAKSAPKAREAAPKAGAKPAPADMDGIDFRALGERWMAGEPMTALSRETGIPTGVIDRRITKLGYTAKARAARAARAAV